MPRKKANTRRRKRTHVLDVKASSSQVRRHRLRMAGSALIGITVLVAIVFALWKGGYWAAQEFIYQNKNLSVRHINVDTDGVIDEQILRRFTRIEVGDNLFEVELREIKRNLELHTMIKHVSLQRSLPDTINMTVTERIPVARIGDPSQARVSRISDRHALDAEGVHLVLEPRLVRPESVPAWDRLPWLTSKTAVLFSPSSEPSSQTIAALEFIGKFNRASIGRRLKIVDINIDDPQILRVRVSNDAVVDVLNKRFDQQLARWTEIHDFLEENRQSYTWMDLSVSNNIPVRRILLAAVQPHSPNRNH